MSATVSERLAAFALQWRAQGVRADVMHEAKRLLLNQWKASVAAAEHPVIGILQARSSCECARGRS